MRRHFTALLNLCGQNPAFTVFVISFSQLILCLLLADFLQWDSFFVGKMNLGGDFLYFYFGGTNLQQGIDPYSTRWLVTPILFSRLLNLTHWTSLNVLEAARLMFCVSLASVVLSYKLLCKDRSTFFLGLGAMLCGLPLFFLIDRGNIDGLVMLLVAIFLLGIQKSSRKWDIISGLALAFAVGLKLYPVILAVPLVFFRRWTVLVSTFATYTILFVSDLSLNLHYFKHRMPDRMSWAACMEQCAGIYGFFRFLGESYIVPFGWDLRTSLVLGYIAIGVLVISSLWTLALKIRSRVDVNEQVAHLLCFLILAIAIPKVANTYISVSLILILPILQQRAQFWPFLRTSEKTLIALATVGLGVLQFQGLMYGRMLQEYLYENAVAGVNNVGFAMIAFGMIGWNIVQAKKDHGR